MYNMIKFQSFAFMRSSKTVYACLTICTFFIIFIVRVMWLKYDRHKIIFSDFDAENDTYNSMDFESITKMQADILAIIRLKQKVMQLHETQMVWNQHLFGPVTSDSIIIVIQVHKKVDHLREILVSLQKVSGIHRALIIFAHDFLNEENQFIVDKIEFAKYMQIYYLFSTQLNPRTFPGEDFTFCSQGYQCETNDFTRDQAAAQSKHFWWWTVNQVFDHLRDTENYNNFIIFLEEDQYVTEDFLYIFSRLKGVLNDCPECEMISLGAHHPKTSLFHVTEGNVIIEPFGSTDYGMGYAFNRTFWNVIKSSSDHFCNVNDYNWEKSLQYLATQRVQHEHIWMLAIEAPRVLFTGACYSKWDDKNSAVDCDLNEKLQELEEVKQLTSRGLYPRGLIIHHDLKKSLRVMPSGRWEDIRDKDLCLFMASDQMISFNLWK